MAKIFIYLAAGLIILIIAINVIGSFFSPFVSWRMIFESLSRRMEPKQTVGEVTVNRDAKGVSIAELITPLWSTKAISPVIGKAYKITKLTNDDKPVHVEFAYNSADIPKGISENFLHLYKWHEERKAWAPVTSSVDTSRKVVQADLTSFSILAVKAPVTAYIGQKAVDWLNTLMDKMQKDPPQNTCGVVLMIDEELVTFNGKDKRFDYSRPIPDQIEVHDCVSNGKTHDVGVVQETASYEEGGSQGGYHYVISPKVVWQIDPDEDAVVKGVIKDQDGNPMPGVTLNADKITYTPGKKSTKTDSKGQYELDLHSGEYTITTNSECNGEKITDKFFAWGTLPEDPHKVGPWTKDLTLKCPDFTIDDSQTILSNTPVEGAIGVQMDMHTEDTYIAKGSQLEKPDNGFGWEGKWEMTLEAKIKGSSNSTITGPNGIVVDLPASSVDSDATYKFDFTIPPHPANNYPLEITGTLATSGDIHTQGESGAVTANGWAVTNIPGSSSNGSNSSNWVIKGQLVDISTNGATYKLDKLYRENENILIHLKRLKNK